MLLAGVEHNKATEPEKQVSRILSPFWTMPIDRGKSFSPDPKTNHAEKGKVLRVGNHRTAERRKKIEDETYLDENPERRFFPNRKPYIGWSPDTHDILVIAVARKPGQQNLWKEGDDFVIRSGNNLNEGVAEKSPPQGSPALTPPSQDNSSLVKGDEDEDYVVHLSSKSPER
jgi:hypothetical protein